MEGIPKILEHLEEGEERSELLGVAVRIRPFFDSERRELRRCSILLFGNLSRSSHSQLFRDQILNSLVPLLLHLQDPQPDVVK
ncbi:maestro heat-like repeat-containing protein family member 1, partial [Cyanistes caeruleus]|uniref:maestro heat-like repeat-containing protein family member 1 n=1 Tax=Cyanistes caeruleus TaxID=156563 RepID=UPI000CDA31DC